MRAPVVPEEPVGARGVADDEPGQRGQPRQRVVAAQLGEPLAQPVGGVLRAGLDAVAEQGVQVGAVEQRRGRCRGSGAPSSRVELVDLQAGRLRRRGAVRLAGQRGARAAGPASARPARPSAARRRRRRTAVTSTTRSGSIAASGRRVGVQRVVVGRGGEAGLELGLVHPAARRTARTPRPGTPRPAAGSAAAARPRPAGAAPSSALAPVSTSRNRRAVTGGKATVRTGTALSRVLRGVQLRHAPVGRRRRRWPPAPRTAAARRRSRAGPGRPTVTAATVHRLVEDLLEPGGGRGRPGRGAARRPRRSCRRAGADQSPTASDPCTDGRRRARGSDLVGRHGQRPPSPGPHRWASGSAPQRGQSW